MVRPGATIANWSGFDPSTMNKFAVKKNCLLGWLMAVNLVTDPGVKTMAEKALQSVGLKQEARKLNSKILKYLNSKEKQISTVVHFLRIPRKEAKLVYFDVKHGVRREKVIEKFRG